MSLGIETSKSEKINPTVASLVQVQRRKEAGERPVVVVPAAPRLINFLLILFLLREIVQDSTSKLLRRAQNSLKLSLLISRFHKVDVVVDVF